MSDSFSKLFAELDRAKKRRIKQAGKHKCVRVKTGAVRRVTGGKDGIKILKRPILLYSFYECKLCGRVMK